MIKNRTRGFTLIELLVVIAIIGILSSVVLASLTTARTKGKDAAVQAQLSNMRAQAELYYSTNSNAYAAAASTTGACSLTAGTNTNVFNNGTNNLITLLGGVQAQVGTFSATNSTCNASATAWAAAVNLPSGGSYCVDSTGVSRSKTAAGVDYTATIGSAITVGAFACN